MGILLGARELSGSGSQVDSGGRCFGLFYLPLKCAFGET